MKRLYATSNVLGVDGDTEESSKLYGGPNILTFCCHSPR